MNEKKYCNVVVNTKNRNTDLLYTYHIPQKFINKLRIGSKVIVPFGLGSKLLEGFIFELLDESPYNNVKDVFAVLNEEVSLTKKQIDLCKWLRKEYLCTYYDGISCLIPTGTTLSKRKVYSINTKIYIDREKLTEDQLKIIELFKNNKTMTLSSFKKIMTNDIKKEFNKLLKEKYILEHEEFYNYVKTKYKKIVGLNIDNCDFNNISNIIPPNANKQKIILNYLKANGTIELSKLINETKVSRYSINSLKDKGLIKIENIQEFRDPFNSKTIIRDSKKKLNSEQEKAYYSIKSYLDKNIFKTFLLHGVTGSGKTEVYMNLVEDQITKGKQTIILVPEISLTPQIVNKFISRFGKKVAVFHSKLSLGERYDQWRKVKNNEISIVIGARSAIFAPCNNLGLIIIDEEHESTYKSDTNPKYHTIEVAKYICEQNNAVLLLGTATPSIESYYKSLNGEYELLKLNKRFNKNPLPKVEIVDMRVELKEGNKSIFSRKLYNSIKKNLESKKQIILFLNRRGHSTFISCRNCGYILKCNNCDISLTLHQLNNVAKCHYCGFSTDIPRICPECGSNYIKYFGIGTEKVEEQVKKYFPNSRVKRLDLDTTSKKGELERIINSFEKREIDILIGTQMVTKGLDFPFVTLVGVLSADTIINLPDYRSNERTFQLLTQVAGRAGRHDFSGEVVVQTYNPENYAVLAAKDHDYIDFYKKEIDIRREFSYPPFYKMINLIIYGKNEQSVIQSSYKLFNKLKKQIYNNNKEKNIFILGPNPAIHSKIKGNFRWQIIIKYNSIDHEKLKIIINDVCNKDRKDIIKDNVKLSYDLNPYNIF